MPELPEVETVVRELQPRLAGRRITSVQVSRKLLRRPWSRAWNALLRGRGVAAIERRGKWIVIHLEGSLHLVLHLGMTGQLVVHPAGTPRANHTHLVFELDTGEELRFRDIRRFGSATLLHGQALAEFFERIKLGPEPFDIEARTWRESLGATARCLKAVLLDQQLVAGVGNIYADESLFEARLHPARAGRSLNAAEAQRLRRALSIVLKRAIARSGTTIRNYVGGSGMTGRYQDEFRVYGRAGQPCRRCQTPIERIRLAGRSTHYCRRCQPAGFRGQGSGVRYKDDPDLCLLTPDP